jgi:hypothetical protein
VGRRAAEPHVQQRRTDPVHHALHGDHAEIVPPARAAS